MAVCVCVRVRVWLCVLIASLLDRAREALRDRATHISGCARPTARCVVALVVVAVVAVVVVPYVVVGRVCVWVCVFFDRARETTRDRATHGTVCAISAARRVAVVAAAAVAYVVAACVCVCVIELVKQRAIARRLALFAPHQLRYVWRWRWWRRWRARWWRVCGCGSDCARPTAICVVAACVAVARVCVCVFCFASLQARALEVSRDRATHSSDCARLTAVCGGGGGGCGGAVCGGGARVCVCVVFS